MNVLDPSRPIIEVAQWGQKLTLGWFQERLLWGELPKQHPDADNKSSDCSKASLYAPCYGVWSAGEEVQTGKAKQANPHGTEQEGSFEPGKRLKLRYYFISLISLVVHDNHSSIPISSYLTNTECPTPSGRKWRRVQSELREDRLQSLKLCKLCTPIHTPQVQPSPPWPPPTSWSSCAAWEGRTVHLLASWGLGWADKPTIDCHTSQSKINSMDHCHWGADLLK